MDKKQQARFDLAVYDSLVSSLPAGSETLREFFSPQLRKWLATATANGLSVDIMDCWHRDAAEHLHSAAMVAPPFGGDWSTRVALQQEANRQLQDRIDQATLKMTRLEAAAVELRQLVTDVEARYSLQSMELATQRTMTHYWCQQAIQARDKAAALVKELQQAQSAPHLPDGPETTP